MTNKKRLIATLCLAVLGQAQAQAATYVLTVPLQRSVAGVNVPSDPSVSLASMSFGPTQAGTSVAPQQFSITNPGKVPLNVGSLRLASGSRYQLESDCTQLQAGESCTATVTADTSAAGNFQDSVQIRHAGPGQVSTVALTSDVRAPKGQWDSTAAFGGVPVGSAKDLQVKLSNKGIGPLAVTSFKADGTGFSFVESDCPSELAVGASCLAVVRMTGEVAGEQTGTLTANSSAGPITLALQGVGQQSDLSFSSGPVANFGRVNVGAYASSATITLANKGNLAATGLALNTTSELYTITDSTCGSSIGANSTCNFKVRFTPTALGSSTAVLNASLDGQVAATSPLSGVGANSAVIVTPSGTIYSVIVGSTSIVYYKVSNTGQTPIALYGAEVLSPNPLMTVEPSSVGGITACTATLAAGAVCGYNFALKATDLGVTGNLTANIMTGSGTFTDTSMGVNSSWAKLVPTPADPTTAFGNVNLGSSATSAVIKLTNKAINATLTNVAYEIPDGFELINSTCGDTVSRNSTCQLQIKFNPVKAGAYAGKIRITTQTVYAGALPYTLEIPVTGTGVAPASLGWVAPSVPDQEVGTTYAMKVGLYNPGTAAVSVAGLTLTGSADLVKGSDTCGSSLPAKTLCQVDVTYNPKAAGTATASIQATVAGQLLSQAITAKSAVATFKASRTTFAFADKYRSGTGISNAFQDISVTYTNSGSVVANDVAMSMVYAPGETHSFTFQNSSCANNLAVGATCTVSVRAYTSLLGSFTGAVRISSRSGVLDVPFTFTTVMPDIMITETSPVKDVAAGGAYTATYTVTNRANLGLISVTVPTITGNTSEFSLASGTTCNGSTLSSAGSCVIKVLFTPTGTGARAPASLNATVAGIARSVPLQASGL